MGTRSRAYVVSGPQGFVIAMVAIVIAGYAMSAMPSREPFTSVETRIVEKSASGLNIVPASCSSSLSPCVGHPGGSGAACAIAVNPTTISAGRNATLSWNSSYNGMTHSSLYAQSYTYGYPPTYPRGNITNIGNVYSGGTLTVSPSQTTTYSFTGSYDYLGLSQYHYPFSCNVTLTVVPNICQTGYHMENGVCVPNAGACSPTYFCVGSDLYQRNAQCIDGFVEACVNGCSGGGCLSAPPGEGNITVSPRLVRSGETTTVSWTTENMEEDSCTVVENNPEIDDSGSGENSSFVSSSIRQQTTYTLICTPIAGGEFQDSAIVDIIPIFEEN